MLTKSEYLIEQIFAANKFALRVTLGRLHLENICFYIIWLTVFSKYLPSTHISKPLGWANICSFLGKYLQHVYLP